MTATAPAGGGLWAGLGRFERLPGWLETVADPEVAGTALRHHIPELLDCDPWRFRLKAAHSAYLDNFPGLDPAVAGALRGGG